MKNRNQRGFSLVEIVIALGVMTFALFSVMALLPIGLRANKTSSDEAQAANILTALEADLRNTYASGTFNGFALGRSQLFNLALPYSISSGRVALNYSLSKPALTTTLTSAFESGFTTGLDSSLNVEAITVTPAPYFQASVIYTAIPSAGSLVPIEARLIINWPAISNNTVSDLTNTSKVRGYVQSYVTFRAP